MEIGYGCNFDICELSDTVEVNTRITEIESSKAGLFSAVITAFIIESYKTLKQDTGDVTVALLAQISNQLANGTNAIILSPTPDKAQFEVPNSALRVNILWFLSLTFSLACALVATLVQQWSRNYLDAVHRKPRPYMRARIRSYLHEGLRNYGMSTVVKTIPTLLHISLFLFFGGLFEFLRPINRAISYLALGSLIVCGSLYMGTAITSVFSPNCPYRMPISGIFWRILNFCPWVYRRWVYRRFQPPSRRSSYKLPGNRVEEAEILSMEASRFRDLSDLRWTLESLTDDTELEPFIEGIPGFVVSRDLSRRDADDILHMVFSEFYLSFRIEQLFQSCNQILEPLRRQKRRVACLSALWTVTSLSVQHRFNWGHGDPPYYLIFAKQQPDWLGSPTIEAHWARCLGTLLFCILFSERGQSEMHVNNSYYSTLLSFLSNIPSFNSLGLQIHMDGLTLSEYRILALIGYLVAPLDGPFDPIAISIHPTDYGGSFVDSLLNVATDGLTMTGVQSQIQTAFAGAVSRTLKHSLSYFPHIFIILNPLVDGLDDPAAIQVVRDCLKDCNPPVLMVRAEQGSGIPDDVSQSHEFTNENHSIQHECREHHNQESIVEQYANETEEHGAMDQDGEKRGGEGRESIENLGMGGSESG